MSKSSRFDFMREDPASVVASQENELPDENKDILKAHDVFPSEMPDDITTKHISRGHFGVKKHIYFFSVSNLLF